MKSFCNFLYLLYKVFEKDTGTNYSLSEINYFGHSLYEEGKFILEHKDKDLAMRYFEVGAIIMNGSCCFELAKIYEQYKEFNKALDYYEELEYLFDSKGTHIIGYQTAYMKLFTIKDEYLDYLKTFDKHVLNNKRINYTKSRKYLGVLLEVNDCKYIAPLSSPSEKYDYINGEIRKSVVPIIRIAISDVELLGKWKNIRYSF